MSLVKFNFYEPSCWSCKLMKFLKTEFPMHNVRINCDEHSYTNSQKMNAKDFVHKQKNIK